METELAIHPPATLIASETADVAAALRGDGQAFARLVQPHLAAAYRVAARQAGSRALAEEAVQEAMAILLRQLDRYQPGTSLRALFFAIAARCGHSLRRSETRIKNRQLLAANDDAPADPAQSLHDRELGWRIDAALETLPERRRMAALLRLDGGLDHREIAAALGTSEQAARQLVYEAVKALRAALADLQPRGGHAS